ncbi:MAG: serine hydrolase [Prochloraceae cyanobacterium]
MTPKEVIERLLTAEKIQGNWFTDIFLKQVPAVQVEQIIATLKQELGAYQEVQQDGNDFLIIFENGSVTTKISLNDRGKIASLFFETPRLKITSLEAALTELKSLPGEISLLVKEGNSEKISYNSRTPLAVGSSFKLAVLLALKSQIDEGKKSWGDVVKLEPNYKSLFPSGLLENWPEGSLLTIESLAALMISQSDNTATDTLIYLVGKDAIEALSPRNNPFLTTREFFILKWSNQSKELLDRYRNNNPAKRRDLLSEIAQYSLPEVSDVDLTKPTALDVEWYFSTEELCNLIDRVKDLPLMGINSGLAKAKDWQTVAYKGGSEPGVLNLTTWLKAKNGTTYCVSATWNNKEAVLEESRFMTLYSSILELLK